MNDRELLDFEQRQLAEVLANEIVDCADTINYAYELIWLRQQVKDLETDVMWFEDRELRARCMHCGRAVFELAPAIPDGYVLVPDDLLVRVSASLGAFTSDEGWRQIDMDNMDSLDALISAAFKPKGETK